jgi:hypothetical protein
MKIFCRNLLFTNYEGTDIESQIKSEVYNGFITVSLACKAELDEYCISHASFSKRVISTTPQTTHQRNTKLGTFDTPCMEQIKSIEVRPVNDSVLRTSTRTFCERIARHTTFEQRSLNVPT